MLTMSPLDADLVPGLEAQDEQAVARFLERYWERAYRVAYQLTGDPGAAEDVAQEAFVAALRPRARSLGSAASSPSPAGRAPPAARSSPLHGRPAPVGAQRVLAPEDGHGRMVRPGRGLGRTRPDAPRSGRVPPPGPACRTGDVPADPGPRPRGRALAPADGRGPPAAAGLRHPARPGPGPARAGARGAAGRRPRRARGRRRRPGLRRGPGPRARPAGRPGPGPPPRPGFLRAGGAGRGGGRRLAAGRPVAPGSRRGPGAARSGRAPRGLGGDRRRGAGGRRRGARRAPPVVAGPRRADGDPGSGAELPRALRVLAVADLLDTLASTRWGGRGLDAGACLTALEVAARRGWHDPEVVRAVPEVLAALRAAFGRGARAPRPGGRAAEARRRIARLEDDPPLGQGARLRPNDPPRPPAPVEAAGAVAASGGPPDVRGLVPAPPRQAEPPSPAGSTPAASPARPCFAGRPSLGRRLVKRPVVAYDGPASASERAGGMTRTPTSTQRILGTVVLGLLSAPGGDVSAQDDAPGGVLDTDVELWVYARPESGPPVRIGQTPAPGGVDVPAGDAWFVRPVLPPDTDYMARVAGAIEEHGIPGLSFRRPSFRTTKLSEEAFAELRDLPLRSLELFNCRGWGRATGGPRQPAVPRAARARRPRDRPGRGRGDRPAHGAPRPRPGQRAGAPRPRRRGLRAQHDRGHAADRARGDRLRAELGRGGPAATHTVRGRAARERPLAGDDGGLDPRQELVARPRSPGSPARTGPRQGQGQP